MRKISAALAAVAIACPMTVGAAELPGAAVPHFAHRGRVHRSYAPAVHYGYYWHQWGLRVGGTRATWYGSRFVDVDPWWWQVRELYECHSQPALQNPVPYPPCRAY